MVFELFNMVAVERTLDLVEVTVLALGVTNVDPKLD